MSLSGAKCAAPRPGKTHFVAARVRLAIHDRALVIVAPPPRTSVGRPATQYTPAIIIIKKHRNGGTLGAASPPCLCLSLSPNLEQALVKNAREYKELHY